MISALMVLSLVSVMATAPVARASPYAVEIRVMGTSGLSFSGSYGDLSGQTSVDGTVPATYTIVDPSGDIVSAVFSKMEAGTLTVQLVKDGVVVESKTTTAVYGFVSVSHSFAEWPGYGGFGVIIGGIVLFAIFWLIVAVLLCVWVYRDAKARGENAALWLIIVLIAGIIGLIIWLIVRPKKKVDEAGG